MDSSNNNIKMINISLEPTKINKNNNNKDKIIETQREKQKRQITTTNKWNFGEQELKYEYQWKLIKEIQENNIINREHCNFIIQQIQRKIYGYRVQDIDKQILLEEKLATLKVVLDLMINCENSCFYCKEKVHVLYEYVREPKQWTLDRLNNDLGHNNDNVVIACLSCNLRRKTMHHDRYVFTKQMNIVKKNI